MVVRSTGTAVLVRLMQAERPDDWLLTDWLLFGPDDREVIEPPAPMLLAAE